MEKNIKFVEKDGEKRCSTPSNFLKFNRPLKSLKTLILKNTNTKSDFFVLKLYLNWNVTKVGCKYGSKL